MKPTLRMLILRVLRRLVKREGDEEDAEQRALVRELDDAIAEEMFEQKPTGTKEKS